MRWSALLRHERRFAEAAAAGAEAAALYARIGDLRNEAVARQLCGLAQLYASEPGLASDSFVEAASAAAKAHVTELGFAITHNLILSWEALGHHALALDQMISCEVHYKSHSSPLFDLRAAWLRGRLLSANKVYEPAASELTKARTGFLERKLHYDAALVGLDLALVYVKQGERRKLAELGQSMYEVFTTKNIPREAVATIQTFADTTRRWLADVDFVERTLAELAPLRRATGR